MEVESGSGPGNVKFLKTESGSGICMQIPAGTRVIYYPVIHYSGNRVDFWWFQDRFFQNQNKDQKNCENPELSNFEAVWVRTRKLQKKKGFI